MDEETPAPKDYTLGDALDRYSVVELDALHARLLAEAERVSAELKAKDAQKAAAASMFKL